MAAVGGNRDRRIAVPELARPFNLYFRPLVRIARLRFSLLVHVQAEDRVVSDLLYPDRADPSGRVLVD